MADTDGKKAKFKQKQKKTSGTPKKKEISAQAKRSSMDIKKYTLEFLEQWQFNHERLISEYLNSENTTMRERIKVVTVGQHEFHFFVASYGFYLVFEDQIGQIQSHVIVDPKSGELQITDDTYKKKMRVFTAAARNRCIVSIKKGRIFDLPSLFVLDKQTKKYLSGRNLSDDWARDYINGTPTQLTIKIAEKYQFLVWSGEVSKIYTTMQGHVPPQDDTLILIDPSKEGEFVPTNPKDIEANIEASLVTGDMLVETLKANRATTPTPKK